VLLALSVPLVTLAASGGGDEAEGGAALRVERSTELPELLLYIDDDSVNAPERTGGRKSVRVECVDADGLVLASQREPWPMTQTDGNKLAPHAHVPVNPARIDEVTTCKIVGTDPTLEADVL
jgi:hypothetical protein